MEFLLVTVMQIGVAEYIALAEAVKEMIYVRSFCGQIDIPTLATSTLYTDNLVAIALTKDDTVSHSRAKLIDVCHHFLREQQNISYQYIPSIDNLTV